MPRVTKTLLILVLLSTASEAIGEPVMETLQEQSECNRKGFFYDHSKEKCTETRILACTDDTLRKLISAKATNAGKWHKLHAEITNKGYEVSQCVQPKDHELVVNYLKRGLWPEFKTVRILTH